MLKAEYEASALLVSGDGTIDHYSEYVNSME